MMNNTSNVKTAHNLSFVPSDALEQNLSLALDSFGQKMGHQKLQEFAARVQGYPTLNHRAKPSYAYQKLAILLTELSNESGAEWLDLDVTSVIIEITAEDLCKIQQAIAMIAQLDKWGSVALTPTYRVGLRYEVDSVEDLSDIGLAQWLQDNDAHRIPLHSEQLHVSDSLTKEIWFSAIEKHGLPFSSTGIEIDKLAEAFQTGSLGDSDWIVVAAE